MNGNFLARAALAITFAGALVGSANADTIYTFSASGPDTGGTGTDSGTASFDFSSATSFRLTLTNTTTSIRDIGAVLDGFTFLLSGNVSGLTLTGINTVDGEADVTCASSCSVNDTNPGAQPTTDWTASNLHDVISMLAGGKLHPYGIVNDTIDGNVNLDGLSNGQHIPYLEGPVTFDFTLSGETSIPGVSNVQFQFGTTAGTNEFSGTCTSDNNCSPGGGGQPPVVPEPGTLAVLGTALAGMALMRRFRNRC